MSTQENNSENVALLSTIFPKRNEPTYALGNAISMFRSMPALRGLWPFSTVFSNGAVGDISDINHHLTNTDVDIGLDLVIAYALFNGSSAVLTRVDGADFDITGTETYIVTAQRGLTMGAWVRFDGLGSLEGIISKWTVSGSQQAYRLFKQANDTIRFEVNNGAVDWPVTSVVTVPATTWTFVAGQFDPGAELAVWVNDTKVSDTSSIPLSVDATTAIFDLGRTDGGSLFDGRMALPFLYASFLPDYMIRQFYWQTKGLFGL